MSIPGLNSALNGVHQAVHKYETHASNISRLSFSEPAEPKQVQEKTQQPSVPQTDTEKDLNNVTASRPGEIEEVDLATEMTGTIVASHNFQANLKIIEQADAITQQLLDIFG
jgi:flagellar basal body rod protein FlgC